MLKGVLTSRTGALLGFGVSSHRSLVYCRIGRDRGLTIEAGYVDSTMKSDDDLYISIENQAKLFSDPVFHLFAAKVGVDDLTCRGGYGDWRHLIGRNAQSLDFGGFLFPIARQPQTTRLLPKSVANRPRPRERLMVHAKMAMLLSLKHADWAYRIGCVAAGQDQDACV